MGVQVAPQGRLTTLPLTPVERQLWAFRFCVPKTTKSKGKVQAEILISDCCEKINKVVMD
jgi:hypothetical protein